MFQNIVGQRGKTVGKDSRNLPQRLRQFTHAGHGLAFLPAWQKKPLSAVKNAVAAVQCPSQLAQARPALAGRSGIRRQACQADLQDVPHSGLLLFRVRRGPIPRPPGAVFTWALRNRSRALQGAAL